MPKNPAKRPPLKGKKPRRKTAGPALTAPARRKPLTWNKRTSESFKAMAANLVPLLAPGRMDAIDAAWDRHHQRLCAIEVNLDRIVAVLAANPKQPADFRLTFRRKRAVRFLSPENLFLRALMLRQPMRVNGTLWRPDKEKGNAHSV